MKRTYLLLIFLFIYLSAKAQEKSKVQLPLHDGLLSYESVVTLDSSYKAQLLYKATKTWFVNTFNSAKAVIQSEDQVNGRFLGKGGITIDASIWTAGSITPDVRFYIQIDVKDGKYRYKIYNFHYFISDLNNNLQAHKFEDGYNLYLTDKTPKGITMSRAGMNERLDKAYLSLIRNIDGLITSLNDAMKKSKSDEF